MSEQLLAAAKRHALADLSEGHTQRAIAGMLSALRERRGNLPPPQVALDAFRALMADDAIVVRQWIEGIR